MRGPGDGEENSEEIARTADQRAAVFRMSLTRRPDFMFQNCTSARIGTISDMNDHTRVAIDRNPVMSRLAWLGFREDVPPDPTAAEWSRGMLLIAVVAPSLYPRGLMTMVVPAPRGCTRARAGCGASKRNW